MKTGCIIQARTSSTRLPEKVLKPLPFSSDISILQQVISRVQQVSGIDTIVIATTRDNEDDVIADVAATAGVEVFRGSKNNVLERYFIAAQTFGLDQVIRVTSDCPCLDPEVTEKVLKMHLQQKADYTSNSLVRTYPHGLDSEVVTFQALEKAYKEATETFEMEHVTPYLYRTKPDAFKIASVEAPPEHTAPYIRVTVDTPEDYQLLCAVYDFLYKNSPYFGVSELISLFQAKPWLLMLNEKVMQKKILHSLDEEVQEAFQLMEKQELYRAKAYFQKKYDYEFKS